MPDLPPRQTSSAPDWPMDRCAECDAPASNGSAGHPPLCEKCIPIWYPPNPPEADEDCRSNPV